MAHAKSEKDFVNGKFAAEQLRKIANALETSEKLFKIKVRLTMKGKE